MNIKSRNTETGRFDIVASAERLAAHGLAIGRVAAAGAYVDLVATGHYPSTAVFGVAAGVMASDFADGGLARHAAWRLKSTTTRFGKWIDHLTDKLFAHAAILSIGASELITGNTFLEKLQGAVMLALDAPIAARDYITTNDRYYADKQGYDIASQNQGKVKAAIGMGTILLASFPITNEPPVEMAVMGGMVAFAYTSIISGISLHESFRNAELNAVLQNSPDPIVGPL